MEYALKLLDDYTEDKSYTYVNGNIMKVNKIISPAPYM